LSAPGSTGPHTRPAPEEPERPPLGGSWALLYGLVLALLAAVIGLFTLFTRAFQ